MNARLIAPLLFLLPLASSTRAQDFQPELKLHDLVGGQSVEGILGRVIDDQGLWNSGVLLDRAVHTGLNAEIVRDGVLIGGEGTRISQPSARIQLLTGLAGGSRNLALLAYLDEFIPPRAEPTEALLRNGRAVLLRGEPLDVAGLPPHVLCGEIEAVAANDSDTVLAVVTLATQTELALLRFRFGPDGSELARELLLQTGQILPDGEVIGDVETPAVNEHGDWIVRLTTTHKQHRLLLDGHELLRAGDLSPVPGRRIAQILRQYDLNDLGGFAAALRLDGDTASNALLLKNGGVLAQEGDLIPSLSPLVPSAALLEPGLVRLSNSGDVYWQALINQGAPSQGSFLRESRVILQAGVSQVGGELVTGFANELDNFEVSPSGRFWIGHVFLQNSGGAIVTADFGAAVPLPGCAANPGTLRLADGLVLAGQRIRLALDGPVAAGSLASVHFSLGAARPGEDCGIATRFGELLIDPARFLDTVVAGRFAGGPVPLDIDLPADPALVDLHLFAQGSFRSAQGLTLTNGLALEIGAP